jgi:hypothetical protein
MGGKACEALSLPMSVCMLGAEDAHCGLLVMITQREDDDEVETEAEAEAGGSDEVATMVDVEQADPDPPVFAQDCI